MFPRFYNRFGLFFIAPIKYTHAMTWSVILLITVTSISLSSNAYMGNNIIQMAMDNESLCNFVPAGQFKCSHPIKLITIINEFFIGSWQQPA